MIDDDYTARMRELERPEPAPTKDLLDLEHDQVEATTEAIDEMDRLCAAIPTDTRGLRR